MSQNGKIVTLLQFFLKRENSALFMKIVQNALFRSCAARFVRIAFLGVKLLKVVTLVSNFLQNGKTARFHWKLYKTFFLGHAQHVLAKSHFWASKFSRSSVTLAWNSLQKGKTVRFLWKLYKTLFLGRAQHVSAKSHFWASKFSKSSHWSEFLYKTENSALFMKIVESALFRSCAARFGQIAFLSVKVLQIVCHTGLKFSSKRETSALFRSWAARFAHIAFLRVKLLKIVTLVANSLQNGKTVAFHEICTKRSFQVVSSTFCPNRIFEGQTSENRYTFFSMKFVQNVLFRSCAARFGKSHFWGSKFWKSSHSTEILFKKGKQCAFHKNCTKRSFQIMRSTFCPSRIFKGQTSENRYTCLKFSSKREDSALFMKIVQNALFRSCAARIGQLAFVSVNVLKIVSHTGLKFSWKRENSALSMKIVQNALFRSSAARFGQIALVSVKVVKIVTLASNSLQKGKTVRFSWHLYKTLFSGREQHVLAKSLFERQCFQNGQTGLKSSSTEKQCTFNENCTKRSFQIMIEGQSSENRHTRLKFSLKRENSALFMKIVGHAQHVFAKSHLWASKLSKSSHWPQFCPKRENSALFIKIVQNPLFRSCGARFGQIAF